jgi:antitoxin component YwqK of YwqJK toxin-antitoxin module
VRSIILSKNYILLVTFLFFSCGDKLDKSEESLANSHNDPAPLPDNIESLALNVEELKDVGGVTFLKNSSVPYSGYAIEVNRGRKNILVLDEGWVVRHVEYFANGLKERDSFYMPESVSMRKYNFSYQVSQFLDGCHTQWYRNGFKKYQAHYIEGKLHGLNTSWYANGSKKEESLYYDGK